MAVVTVMPPATPTDQTLLERAVVGDRPALDELFRRYRQPAYRVAMRLLGQEADALDAVQDGFVKVLTNLPSFEGRSSFKTWLLRVVSNTALDIGRSRGRRESRATNDPAEIADGPLVWDDPAFGLEREDLRAALDAALAMLPETQRQTFVLHADAEMSYRDIAETLEISIGTVMSRLFYARQKLRAALQPLLQP